MSGPVPALHGPSHVPGRAQASVVTGRLPALVPRGAQLSRRGLDQAGRRHGRLAAMLLRLPGVDAVRRRTGERLLLRSLPEDLLHVDRRAATTPRDWTDWQHDHCRPDVAATTVTRCRPDTPYVLVILSRNAL